MSAAHPTSDEARTLLDSIPIIKKTVENGNGARTRNLKPVRAFIGADFRAIPHQLRAVLGHVFAFQRAVSNPLVQLGFAEPKAVAFSRQRHAGNVPGTCPLA